MVAGQLERLVPSSQVVCPSYGASLQFVNIKNLTITNLLFSGCGGSIDSRRLETPHATLAMMDVVDVRISQIVIQNGSIICSSLAIHVYTCTCSRYCLL